MRRGDPRGCLIVLGLWIALCALGVVGVAVEALVRALWGR